MTSVESQVRVNVKTEAIIAAAHPEFDAGKSTAVGQTEVRKVVERAGNGTIPERGARISCVVEAWLPGETAGDPPASRRVSLAGKIGASEIPLGYEVAVSSMTEGEQSLFLIPRGASAPEAARSDGSNTAVLARLELLSVVPPVRRDSALTKDPFSAVAVFGDALLCVAGGRFQPLWGEYAHVVRDAIEGVVAIDTLARTHQLGPDDLELFEGLFDHLVELGVLSVVRPAETLQRGIQRAEALDKEQAKAFNVRRS